MQCEVLVRDNLERIKKVSFRQQTPSHILLLYGLITSDVSELRREKSSVSFMPARLMTGPGSL